MSFMGTVGSVAQVAQDSSAPTGVSIATSSSGNYDNAMIAAEVQFTQADVHNANFSSSFNYVSAQSAYVMTQDVDVDGFNVFSGNAGASDIALKAYCRATGATSFQWTVSVHSDTTYAGGTVAVLTSGGTTQDSTSGNGAGVIRMTFGGSKAGYTFPVAEERMVLKLECTATNSGGSSAAIPIIIKFAYI